MGGYPDLFNHLFAFVSAMHNLASYLKTQVPDGMSYPDAAQLCLRLFCIIEGVPKQFLPLSKEVLGDTFAELAKVGWIREEERGFSALYGANHHQVTDRGHWVEVIASIFKKGPDVVDIARGEALVREVGFVKKYGES
jgi:hypothetical protein